MKIFISGACQPENIFTLMDPTAFSEAEFEAHVVSALSCVYKDYFCIPFRGGFKFDEDVHVADLALVHKAFSHWFVIEVELVSHSLHSHVVPQVRCFEFGAPQKSCVDYLCRYIPTMTQKHAESLLKYVPRSVAVIANRADQLWTDVLRGVNTQFMAVSVFSKHDGGFALETDGSLYVPRESLGFFTYSALSRSIRMARGCGLAEGVIQIQDPYGNVGLWTARASEDALWITKNSGDPGLEDRIMLQMLRTASGELTLRRPAG
jgi:hypothetical protein